jgi:hypothetical protein
MLTEAETQTMVRYRKEVSRLNGKLYRAKNRVRANKLHRDYHNKHKKEINKKRREDYAKDRSGVRTRKRVYMQLLRVARKGIS